MWLKGLIASAFIACAATSICEDFDLVVPRGWEFIRDAKTLVVNDPSGTLKSGDRVLKVVSGIADGAGVRVSSGWADPARPVLAPTGGAENFAGQIILGDGVGGAGLSATLAPAGAEISGLPPSESVKQVARSMPWGWIAGVTGVIAISWISFMFLKKDPVVAGSPIRYTGRKGIEAGIQDIRSRLDDIEAKQVELVKKPPVLRSFRKQIDGFDSRLKHLESSGSDASRRVADLAKQFDKVDAHLTHQAQEQAAANTDSKRSYDLIVKLTSDVAQRSGSVDEQLKGVRAKQEQLEGLPQSLNLLEAKLAQQGAAISSESQRIKELLQSLSTEGAQLEKKLGAVTTRQEQLLGVPVAVQELQKSVSGLATSSSRAEAQFKSLVTAMETIQKGLNAIAIQTAAIGEKGTSVESGLQSLASSARSWEDRLQAIAAQSVGQEGEIKALSELIKSVNSQLEAVGGQTKLFEDQGKALQNGLAAAAEGLAARLDALEDQTRTTSSQTAGSKETLSNLIASLGALEAQLHGVDNRFDSLIQNGEGVRAEVLGLQARVDGVSDEVAKRTEDLAAETKELRKEIAPLSSVAGAVSSLEEQVGSIDKRLLPLADHGNKLTQVFESLKARIEDASSGFGSQVERLESRLEELQAEGSRLAGLPDVANALHGHTAELTEHVRSAEGGLKSLGEELARMQEGLGNGDRRSKAMAEDISKRLEAWEGALADVVSKVEGIKVPEQAVPVVEEAPPARAKKQVKEQAAGLEEVVGTVEQSVAPVATPPKLVLEQGNADQADDDEIDVAPNGKTGRWTSLAGSPERTWSVKFAGGRHLFAESNKVKPLTPIETPAIDYPIGGMVCTSLGAGYVHGDALCSFWPNADGHRVLLKSPVPADAWRLMFFSGYYYVAAERHVEVVHAAKMKKHSLFEGDYRAQAHTESHWTGLLNWGGQLAVDFRDASGGHVGSPRVLPAPSGQSAHLAASGNTIFVSSQTGQLFKVELHGVSQLRGPHEKLPVLGLGIAKGEFLFETMQGPDGVVGRLSEKSGEVLKETPLFCKSLTNSPVLIGDKIYCFDDSSSELITINLKNLQVVERKRLEGIGSIRRLVGIASGKSNLLVAVVANEKGVCTKAVIIDPKTGQELVLCGLNQTNVDLVVGDNHVVVATSTSYQNTISVFNPFEAAESRQRQAA